MTRRCLCNDGFVLTYALPDGTILESGRCARCMARTSADWERAMARIRAEDAQVGSTDGGGGTGRNE